MFDQHKEKAFEQELVAYLTAHGWLEGDASEYDRELALYPSDLIGWIQDTQPKEWEKVINWHEINAEQALCDRLAKLMDDQGSLSLLRHGFKDKNARFQLCQFKPSHGFNPEIAERYAKVRCRIVRQVRYSTANENCIDLVLFINGIPVATLELKTDFTQSVHDAIRQYRFDRLPRVDGKPIIIVTIQTFPFVLDSIQELTSLKSRRFAVIIPQRHGEFYPAV